MNEYDKKQGQELSHMLLEYRDVLFSYIMALVRDFSDAEELFQDVALVILNKEKEGILVENFGAWSREIARRKILEFWETQKKKKSRFLSPEALETLEAEFARREEDKGTRISELLHKLQKCLQELPEHLRKLIDLRYTSDLSFRDIGRKIKRSAGAAQVTLSRTRQRLLDCMQRFKKVKGPTHNES